MMMLPRSMMPPGYYIPVAHAVVAFDTAAVPRVEDPPLIFPPPPPACTAVAAATSTAVRVSTAVGAKRAARALTALSSAKVRGVCKPNPKPKPQRRNQTGRTLVPTQDRTDNQITKLLRHVSGTGNGKYDKRDVGTRMTNLSDVLGLVNITTMAMMGKPQLLAAYHVVLHKASAVAQERRLLGKTRSAYTDEFKDAVMKLLTDEGVAFLQDALRASV